MEKQTKSRGTNGASGGGTGTLSDPYEQLIERGEAHSIALEDIEKGITALWQAAGKRAEGEGESPVMRTCVLNLIIYTSSDQELTDATNAIALLTGSFPCRAIVLQAKQEEKEEAYNAWISAHCQIPEKGRKVCCEQITIVGKGSAVERMGSMVIPLLVPDLPIILWWKGVPDMNNPVFVRLFGLVDRLIIDSRNFKDPAHSFQLLSQMSKDNRQGTRISDLGWARLTPWRQAISHLFDRTDFLPYLFNIDRLEVEYEAPDDNSEANFSEGFLLVGWLSKALNWQPVFNLKIKGSNASLIMDRGGQPLNVEFHGHNDRKDDLGGVTAIKLYSSNPETGNEATFSVSLDDDYEHVNSVIMENGEAVFTRTSLMLKRSIIDLMHEELGIISGDEMYDGALYLAGRFVGK